MKYKRIVSIVISVFLILLWSNPIFAHTREDHDDDIEYILFGDAEYKETHPIVKSKIQAIEDATYLCVDQYNGNGSDELANLHNEKIPNIPKSIEEFDFTANYAHRNYTHRGWNVDYSEKSHWDIRTKILYNTVEKELFTIKTPLSWFPWLNNIVYGKQNNKQQCQAFCKLLYYIHIIGDHIEAEKFDSLAYVDALTNVDDRDNPGVIPDLLSCCDDLFAEQIDSYTYKEFRQELEELKDISEKLTGSKGGVNTEEKFDEYHQCAMDLREVLATYIPKLLENESFWTASFE